MKVADYSRRRFLGLSAMATAAIYGSTAFSLTSCKKEYQDPFNSRPKEPIYGEDVDVVVIGSGFGGAVSALRMTEAGLDTIMLEMGKHYEVTDTHRPFSTTFAPDGRSVWLRNKTVLPYGPTFPIQEKGLGVLDRVDYDNMKVYRGTCLGGGSVVYGAMLPQADPLLWDDEFPDIDYSEMQSVWYPKVRSVIPVRRVPEDILNSKYYEYARVGLKHAVKAGMEEFYIPGGVDFDRIRMEFEGKIPKHLTNGDLLYGDNSNAKHSVDKNYIADAMGTGKLTIQTQSKVQHIEEQPDGRYEILVDRIDHRGRVRKQNIIRAKYVFVTAGVVGTNGILLRSQANNGLANLENIGQNVGTNGNIMSVRAFFGETVGVRQCIIPVTGYYQPDNPHGIFLAEQAPLPVGLETLALGVLGVTFNEYRGQFKLDENDEVEGIKLHWAKNGLDQGIAATKDFTEKILNANSGKLMKAYFPPTGYSDDFTYHPLGGVVRNEASDAYGRLKGHKNIYCVDGSMVPGYTCAANPALTIAAIAERCLDNIVQNDLF